MGLMREGRGVNKLTEVYFFLNNKEFAYRGLVHIPRVGDEVIFDGYEGERTLEVKRVVHDLTKPLSCCVNIELAYIETKGKANE